MLTDDYPMDARSNNNEAIESKQFLALNSIEMQCTWLSKQSNLIHLSCIT